MATGPFQARLYMHPFLPFLSLQMPHTLLAVAHLNRPHRLSRDCQVPLNPAARCFCSRSLDPVSTIAYKNSKHWCMALKIFHVLLTSTPNTPAALASPITPRALLQPCGRARSAPRLPPRPGKPSPPCPLLPPHTFSPVPSHSPDSLHEASPDIPQWGCPSPLLDPQSSSVLYF